ncbi:EF-hand domain-containing protein [Nitratidesulfovibrio sp. SRB-5]|uniref:EF-hand domain-containing protein n=1 Tax=Nitratidesulfovibrio sp. SRB-5 TaxID=2872636 RepID=UPI001026A9AE|nr:EF-hand domain-containing protein [Nitratidesulfovibrio sp. SRB-5]MBZ2172891.1 calcium-binding protein [Nitratidesulfovibrio sp. SRB-5]RXF76958.1 calcium-binding protein [Desulfovibrio sp. DS-1]
MNIENHGGISSSGWDPWHGRGRGVGRTTARLASAMMEELDADDDGSLSATESQLSESAFAALDKNGDGAVSSRELRAGLRSKRDELIDLMRSDTGTETGTGETPAPTATTGPTAEQASAVAGLLIEKGDADGDGALSAAETGLAGDVFTSLDTDGDGLLSSGELSTAALAGAIAATLDGKLAVRLTAPATLQGTGTADTTDGGTDTTATTAAGAAAADTASTQAGTVGAMASRIALRIVERLDADDNGSLSQSESGLDQNRFAQLDTDGDGSVTANEFGGSLQQMLDVMGALHALSSVARSNYGRKAYGMAAREAVERYEGNMGGLMTALFETAPTGSTGTTTDTSGAVAATGGSASGDAGTATADSSTVGDIADVLADAAATEAAQAATGAAGNA